MEKTIKDTKGGVANIEGINYQLYWTIYYLLTEDISEIIIEWYDEDIILINEERTGPSLTFIQCKYIGAGSLTFSKFLREIIPRFLTIFEKFKKEDPTTKYSFWVVCNTGVDKKLKDLLQAGELLRKGALPQGIEKIYGRKILHKIKDVVKNKGADIYSFLRILHIKQNVSEERLRNDIRKFLIELGSADPDNDIKKMIGYFIEKGSGRITKNQLRHDLNLDYSLYKISEQTNAPFSLKMDVEEVYKIKMNAYKSYSYISDMYEKAYELEKIVTFAEVTTNQIHERIKLFPKGSPDRRELERVADDAVEIAGSLTEEIKRIKESLHSVKSKYEEIILIRKRLKLDESDESEVEE